MFAYGGFLHDLLQCINIFLKKLHGDDKNVDAPTTESKKARTHYSTVRDWTDAYWLCIILKTIQTSFSGLSLW